MTVHASQIAALADAIARVRKLDAPADATLRALFREKRAMGQKDRAFVAEGTFAFLRRMRSIATLAQTDRPRLLALAVAVRELGSSVRELEDAT